MVKGLKGAFVSRLDYFLVNPVFRRCPDVYYWY